MIRLVVVDVDGVLSPGEGAPLDFAVLQRVAEFNDRARQDSARPAVTLCTGRPAPYVEVLTQAIHGFYPAIYENGAGLFVSEPYGFKSHSSITPEIQARLAQFQAMLQDALVAPNLAYLQPGKSSSLSLFAREGVLLHEVYREAGQLAYDCGDEFVVEETATCVNVIVRGVDKAEGVRWLSRETSIALGDMAGVGDSQSDLKFMQLVGWLAAPANAHASVKQVVHYVSPYENGRGLVDILEALG